MSTALPPPLTTRKRTRRRRLVRTLLLKFLKRLKKACEVLETPAQWYDVTKELRGMLNEYRDVLPSGDRDALWLATLLTDQSHAGITQACTILQSRLVSVIATLPAGGIAAPALIGAALVVTAVAVVAVVVLNTSSVTLTIQNANCETFTVTGAIPVAVPGMELPAFVRTNESETAQLPPVTLNTEFRPPNGLQVSLFGAPLLFGLPARVSSASLDGVELLAGVHTIELGRQPQHTLVVRCG